MPYLVSGAPTGHFVVWDLEKRRMHHVREAHRGPITHMAFVPKEPLLITSGTDNAVKMWIFDTADGMSRYLQRRCGCPGPARKLQFYGEGDKELIVGGGFKGNALESIPLGQRGPSCLIVKHFGVLVACGLDDGTLAIVDLNSKSIVRSFQCGVPATDLAFAPDGRWLAAAVCDGGLRIFDLPAARCIDSFLFAQPALGLCFSPSGAFLVTSHAKNNAIQVWANKFLFDPSLSAPLLRPEPEAPINVEEPGAPDEEEEEQSTTKNSVSI
eukprot:g11399.t1